MVKKALTIIAVVFFVSVHAQDENFRYVSVLKGDATITPGYLLNTAQTNIYINGSLEYFPDDKISLRGEGFWMVGAQQKPALLKDNSTLLFGGLYHFHKNRLDYFVGLQMGAGITKPNDVLFNSSPVTNNPTTVVVDPYTQSYIYKVVPVLSPVTGVTFYVSNYFNFFLNVRYVKATYFGYTDGKALSLDELRISAGLGFQIHLKKKE